MSCDRGASFRGIVAALLTVVASALAPAAVCARPGPGPAPSAPPGLHLEKGSIARQPIVAVGRSIEVDGEALAGVTAIHGSVTVTGRVVGDVTVLGGDLHLAARARIEGDALILGGRFVASRDSFLSGRAVAYPTVSHAWLTLLEGPSLGLDAGSPLVLGAKLGLVAAWLALTLLLFSTAARSVVRTADEIRLDPLRCFATGLVGVASIVLTTLFFSALLPSLVAVPMLVLVVLGALALKLWGMVAVFHGLGRWLARKLARGRMPRVVQLHAAVYGLLALGALKLVPYLGIWAWTAATLIGIGAALRTKFGRYEPWFENEGVASV